LQTTIGSLNRLGLPPLAPAERGDDGASAEVRLPTAAGTVKPKVFLECQRRTEIPEESMTYPARSIVLVGRSVVRTRIKQEDYRPVAERMPRSRD
jgi:hypothetical protein